MANSFGDYCRARSPNTLTAAAILALLFIGWLDFLTGWEISFFIFYGGPIFFGVWFLDRRRTVLLVAISGIVWWWADWQDGHPYVSNWLELWEALVRMAFFCTVAVGGWAIKSRRDSQRARLADLQRMSELERELVVASEREQQRIGADLHDGLCQYLAGIACMTGSLRDDLAERFQPEAETVAEIQELLKCAIVQARSIARGLAPVHMDEAGLASGLEELAGSTEHLHGIQCAFEASGDAMVSDRDTAIHLYRIAQEAVSNAVRHGHADCVEIQLSVGSDLVELAITDDGSGFPEGIEGSQGMGLRSMRYRAGALGGILEIEALPGGGTCVCCRVPTQNCACDRPDPCKPSQPKE